jgi:hypothetical protein
VEAVLPGFCVATYDCKVTPKYMGDVVTNGVTEPSWIGNDTSKYVTVGTATAQSQFFLWMRPAGHSQHYMVSNLDADQDVMTVLVKGLTGIAHAAQGSFPTTYLTVVYQCNSNLVSDTTGLVTMTLDIDPWTPTQFSWFKTCPGQVPWIPASPSSLSPFGTFCLVYVLSEMRLYVHAVGARHVLRLCVR